MTSREARKQRREAERQAQKAEYRRELEARRAQMNRLEIHSTKASRPKIDLPEIDRPANRSEINRGNAQYSTGPRTAEGKARSSQNSFKHGLYSKHLVMPGEDPAELDRLKAGLIAEHQPANDTEAILVNELAEHFWRIRRMRRLEAEAFTPDKLAEWHASGFLAQIGRIMTAAERGFHKALTTLRQLQSARGFVPQNRTPAAREGREVGFVPQNAELQPVTGHAEPENQPSDAGSDTRSASIASQSASETPSALAEAVHIDTIPFHPKPQNPAWTPSRRSLDQAA